MTNGNGNQLVELRPEGGPIQSQDILIPGAIGRDATNVRMMRQVNLSQARVDKLTNCPDTIPQELISACRQLNLDAGTSERACLFLKKYYDKKLSKTKNRGFNQHFGLTRNVLVGAFIRIAIMDDMSLTEIAGGLGLPRKKLARASKRLAKYLEIKMIRPTNDSILERFSEKMHVPAESSRIAREIMENPEFGSRSVNMAETTKISIALFLGDYLNAGSKDHLKLTVIQDKTNICVETLRRSLKKLTIDMCNDNSCHDFEEVDSFHDRRAHDGTQKNHIDRMENWPERISKESMVAKFGLEDRMLLIVE